MVQFPLGFFFKFQPIDIFGFLLLSEDVFLSWFSLTVIDSQGTLHLALGLVGKNSATVPCKRPATTLKKSVFL